MRGGIPPLPQYAFMAWCSVKAEGQLYFYHTLGIRRSIFLHNVENCWHYCLMKSQIEADPEWLCACVPVSDYSQEK
jgi:hypothetical protein